MDLKGRKCQEARENCIMRISWIVLFTKYQLIIKSRRIRCARHVTDMGEVRNVCKILIRNPEGKRPLWWHRCKWRII
jgi:hypothetical protein